MLSKILLVLVLAALALPASAFDGRVIAVQDGDTITVLAAGNQQVKVRLAQIDAPEKAQDFGKVSKQALSDLVSGKQVTVEADLIMVEILR